MSNSKKNKNECYCCQEIAETKDHIPPKCFFPKKEDLPQGYLDKTRGNLITVPSCKQHNNGRSKDDEYTAAFLAINSYEASSLAKRMSETKHLFC